MYGGNGSFAERLLTLLDQASVATTYKYAVVLALLDASLAATDQDGTPPERIEVATLAEHVLAMYWPHTDPYPVTGGVLRQSGTGQAELVSSITRFRAAEPAGRSTLASARYSPGFDRLRASVAWKLAEMPLPRLQRVGAVDDRFLYDIAWDETITRRQFFAWGCGNCRKVAASTPASRCGWGRQRLTTSCRGPARR